LEQKQYGGEQQSSHRSAFPYDRRVTNFVS
jgi:hypothetical protein